MVSVPPPLLPNPERSITEDDPPAGVLKTVAVQSVSQEQSTLVFWLQVPSRPSPQVLVALPLQVPRLPPVVAMVMLPPGFGLVPPLALSSPLEVTLPALMVTV